MIAMDDKARLLYRHQVAARLCAVAAIRKLLRTGVPASPSRIAEQLGHPYADHVEKWFCAELDVQPRHLGLMAAPDMLDCNVEWLVTGQGEPFAAPPVKILAWPLVQTTDLTPTYLLEEYVESFYERLCNIIAMDENERLLYRHQVAARLCAVAAIRKLLRTGVPASPSRIAEQLGHPYADHVEKWFSAELDVQPRNLGLMAAPDMLDCNVEWLVTGQGQPFAAPPVNILAWPLVQTTDLTPTYLHEKYVESFYEALNNVAEAYWYSADYEPGKWTAYTLDNGGFYLAPHLEPASAHGFGIFDAALSKDAFGITCCLLAFATNDKSRRSGDTADKCGKWHTALKQFALQHDEGAEIFRALHRVATSTAFTR